MTKATTTTSDQIENFLSQLRGLKHWGRRKILRKQKPGPFPRFFYKYIPFDEKLQQSLLQLSGILLQSQLRLSSPTEFNDPYDLSCFTDYSGTPAEKRKRLENVFKDQRPDLSHKDRQQQISDMLLDQDEMFRRSDLATQNHANETGVCCFTTDPSSILMWSHYGRQHKGLVLQFETTKDLNVFTRPIPVKYDDNYPIRRWVDNDLPAINKMLTQKFSQWSYEKESRIVLPGQAKKFLPFLPIALSGVIFGCKAEESTQRAVLDILNKRSTSLPKLYQAIQHKKRYTILIRKIKADQL